MFRSFLPHPAADKTSVTGSRDFTLKIALGQARTRDQVTRLLTEAIEKQLGRRIEPGPVPQPAMVIDSADQTPTPNAADIASQIPSPAAAAAGAAKQAGDASAAPPEFPSIFDAFQKQLGLKLEQQRRSVPALVPQAIAEKPTEN